VLVSTVLVLGMSPALALFEAGMLRSKNSLSLITQIFSGVIALSVLWVLVGYSLVFSGDAGGFIGDFGEGMWINRTFCYIIV
jgi:Amt family ammonium transporter